MFMTSLEYFPLMGRYSMVGKYHPEGQASRIGPWFVVRDLMDGTFCCTHHPTKASAEKERTMYVKFHEEHSGRKLPTIVTLTDPFLELVVV